jgi:hypothetical protein
MSEPTEIVVTSEMIAAGLKAFEAAGEIKTEVLLERIYRAMTAQAVGVFKPLANLS